VVYAAVTGCHIEFHTTVFCNAPLLLTVIRSNPVTRLHLPDTRHGVERFKQGAKHQLQHHT